MEKSKRPFLKSKRSFRRRLPPIGSGDRIDYRNMSLISRFISEQGKIYSDFPRQLSILDHSDSFLDSDLYLRIDITSLFPLSNKPK